MGISGVSVWVIGVIKLLSTPDPPSRVQGCDSGFAVMLRGTCNRRAAGCGRVHRGLRGAPTARTLRRSSHPNLLFLGFLGRQHNVMFNL